MCFFSSIFFLFFFVFFLLYLVFFYFFFFSSRRRHTRYWRDWSSDVCSSDLTDVGLHETVGECLQLGERRDAEQQTDRHQQRPGGSQHRRWQDRPHVHGERMRAEHRIEDDLERHRVEQREGAREQPDPEQARQVEPVRPRLAQQSPVQAEIAHKASLRRRRSTISRIVAVAALHCSTARAANRSAPKPSTAAATQA